MDPSKLTDRLRGIIQPPSRSLDRSAARAEARAYTRPELTYCADASVDAVLGGSWHEGRAGRCLIVHRSTATDMRHGRMSMGEWAERIERGRARIPLLVDGVLPHQPLLFFDLETTGLSGGAGTSAFLVGCGWFDETGSFQTRQFLLVDQDGEPAFLGAVADALGKAGALVSFNGKSFDAPLLEMRYLFHRLDWTPRGLPHFDVLHPARRFWGRGLSEGARETADCSLSALESMVLGVRRRGDVMGAEIPARYFHFLRSGDAQPLAAVMEHNRLDLLSLACLTAWLLSLVEAGAASARTTAEACALGRLYGRAGLDVEARVAFIRAMELGRPSPAWFDALRSLALLERRARRFHEAARWWTRALEEPRCPSGLVSEAAEALAVHHEHRMRNLEAARAFATRSLDDRRPGWTRHVRHRLARLDRKMDERGLLLG